MTHRPLTDIAREINEDWKRPHFAAVPYLNALAGMHCITDRFGHDDARGIVLYFLSNAGSWRGPVAKRIKAELKAALK
jgi:hypothetical protein